MLFLIVHFISKGAKTPCKKCFSFSRRFLFSPCKHNAAVDYFTRRRAYRSVEGSRGARVANIATKQSTSASKFNEQVNKSVYCGAKTGVVFFVVALKTKFIQLCLLNFHF